MQRLTRLAVVIAGFALVSVAPVTEAAKEDTPFGVGFSLANYPNGGPSELLDFVALANTVGSHASFVWSWKNQSSKALITGMVPVLQQSGLEVLVQVAPTALGAPVPPTGYVKDWSDPTTRQKYLDDVAELASARPDYLNLCAEVNLMHYLNPDQFEAYKTIYQEAYDLAKSISPETQVGVSFLDVVWIGFREFTLDQELGTMDWVGFTTYPGKLWHQGILSGDTIEEIAPWYSIIGRVYPDKPIIFSEVGWASVATGSEEEQRQFVEALPVLMDGARPVFITWTLLHDTQFFDPNSLSEEARQILEGLGVDPAELFSRFNGMGLLHQDGTPKPSWFEATKLDFSAWDTN